MRNWTGLESSRLGTYTWITRTSNHRNSVVDGRYITAGFAITCLTRSSYSLSFLNLSLRVAYHTSLKFEGYS